MKKRIVVLYSIIAGFLASCGTVEKAAYVPWSTETKCSGIQYRSETVTENNLTDRNYIEAHDYMWLRNVSQNRFRVVGLYTYVSGRTYTGPDQAGAFDVSLEPGGTVRLIAEGSVAFNWIKSFEYRPRDHFEIVNCSRLN